MARRYAALLSCWTLAVVCVIGACDGAEAAAALRFGLEAMVVMAALGAFIGWIGDQLVQQTVELQFRRRVDRFHTELADLAAQTVRATGAAGEQPKGTANGGGPRGSHVG
jgi:hypothetical protein